MIISRMVARGMSLGEVHDTLSKPENQEYWNPQTQEPYTYSTVARDVQEIRAEWRKEYARVFDWHVARMLAEIRELRRQAWLNEDLYLVLKCCDRECKLLGLDKPGRLIVDWRTEALAAGVEDPDALFEQLQGEAFSRMVGEHDPGSHPGGGP